jgi:hypothetical protein
LVRDSGKNRLKPFDNRVLRRILDHKEQEMSRAWRKLDNEELHQTLLGSRNQEA